MISLNYFLNYIWIIWYLIWKNVPICWFFSIFFYAKRPVKIDWVKNSKFRKLTFFGIIILHIFLNFDDDCIKTLGGVRANARNMPILTIRLTPVTLTLVRQPRPYCLDASLINTNTSWKFGENQTITRGSNENLLLFKLKFA